MTVRDKKRSEVSLGPGHHANVGTGASRHGTAEAMCVLNGAASEGKSKRWKLNSQRVWIEKSCVCARLCCEVGMQGVEC